MYQITFHLFFNNNNNNLTKTWKHLILLKNLSEHKRCLDFQKVHKKSKILVGIIYLNSLGELAIANTIFISQQNYQLIFVQIFREKNPTVKIGKSKFYSCTKSLIQDTQSKMSSYILCYF